MNNRVLCLPLLLMMCIGAFAQSAAPRAKTKKTAASAAAPNAAIKFGVPQILDRQLSNLEGQLVPAAEAMPEDKFNFAPSNELIKGSEFSGVKTFALQVRHIAARNTLLAASLNGQPA